MRLYITEVPLEDVPGEWLTTWHATKDLAMRYARGAKGKWQVKEVPTKKADLIAFLNEVSGNPPEPRPPQLKYKPSKPAVRRGARI
jgi:hypothetical protein